MDKIEIQLYDVELKKIQDDLALKSLENESMIGLIKLFQTENERLETNSILTTPEPENVEESVSEIETLKETYRSLLKIFNSIPVHSPSFENLRMAKRRYEMSFPVRRDEFERLRKQCEETMQNPRHVATKAKLSSVKSKVNNLKHELQSLQQEDDELSAQLQEREERHREMMNQKIQELAETEKKISEAQKFINSSIEEELEAEIAALEEKQKHLNQQLGIDDDDDDSSISSFMDPPMTIPVIEKVTMDLTSFFKNPNDFPFLVSKVTPGATKLAVEKSPIRKENEKPFKKPQELEKTAGKQRSSPSAETSSSSAKKFCPDNRHLKPQNSNERTKPKKSMMPPSFVKSPISRIDLVPSKKRESPFVGRIERDLIQKVAVVSSPTRPVAVASPAQASPGKPSQSSPYKLRSSLKRKLLVASTPKSNSVKIPKVQHQSDVIESSEPEKQSSVYQPRSLAKAFEVDQKDAKSRRSSPGKEASEKTDQIEIPETPEEEEAAEEEAQDVIIDPIAVDVSLKGPGSIASIEQGQMSPTGSDGDLFNESGNIRPPGNGGSSNNSFNFDAGNSDDGGDNSFNFDFGTETGTGGEFFLMDDKKSHDSSASALF